MMENCIRILLHDSLNVDEKFCNFLTSFVIFHSHEAEQMINELMNQTRLTVSK